MAARKLAVARKFIYSSTASPAVRATIVRSQVAAHQRVVTRPLDHGGAIWQQLHYRGGLCFELPTVFHDRRACSYAAYRKIPEGANLAPKSLSIQPIEIIESK